MIKLSIIITVYNKEQYLRRALDSLLCQIDVPRGEYEILAVNDGSTDDSLSILEEYVQAEDRIRILSQNNQGLSMARNNGVDNSRGEYVWFVDADDTFSPQAVKLIIDAIESQPDVIPIYARFEGIDAIFNCIEPIAENGKDVLLSRWSHCGVFWVIRRNFLIDNDLRFFPGIYHEDAEFTPRMLYAAKTVKVIPHVLYIVDCDPNSITQVPRPKRAFDCLTVAEHLYDFIEGHHERGTAVGKVLDYNISVVINNGLDVIIKNGKEEQSKFNILLFEKKKLLKSLFASPLFKYRIEAFLFRLFPRHYVGIYKTMKLFG